MVLHEFELEPSRRGKAGSLDILNQFLISKYSQRQRVALIVDEAQNLSREALEEIRMISNLQSDKEALIQILLVGQPELREKIMRYPQLEQRVALKCYLRRFGEEDTRKYVKHRLQVAGAVRSLFTPGVLYQIHKVSNGVPRRINNVADMCLLEAANRGVETVDEEILKYIV